MCVYVYIIYIGFCLYWISLFLALSVYVSRDVSNIVHTGASN